MQELHNLTPAIVCDADKLSQIAVIQELGRLRIPVIAIASAPDAIGFASKYVTERIVCSVPSHDDAYVGYLQGLRQRGVIFYSNDASAENISRHREQLIADRFSIFVADIGTLKRVIQKEHLYETALECGIAVPKCVRVETVKELRSVLPAFHFPVILKSTNLAGGIYERIDTLEDAPAVLRRMRAVVGSEGFRHRQAGLMVQQWIPQQDMTLWNFNACAKGGEIIAFSMGRRIRTDVRADGTLGSILLFGRTEFDSAIHAANETLLRHLKFDGVVETEWSKSSNGSDIYLYDFNPRFSGNIRWTFSAGVSLAGLVYRIALGQRFSEQHMKTGINYAKVLYRQNDLLEAFGNRNYSKRQKIAVLKDDLLTLLRCKQHAVDILDLSDLRPTIHAIAELLSALTHRVAQRLRRKFHPKAWRSPEVRQVRG
jgi:predicted ATP-grasp superfamily ATP-dependent carboligase